MADLIRASSLMNVPELIAAHGGDPDRLLAAAGLEPAKVGDFTQFVTYSALAAVVGMAADELGVADFGLRLSRLQSLEMLGPIAVLARNADTVEKALLGVIKFLHTYSPAFSAELHSGPRESSFNFAIAVPRVPHAAQMVELALGFINGMFGVLVGNSFRPNRICFEHSRISEDDVYIDYFGCAVHFDSKSNAVVFPSGLLSRHIESGDLQAHALANRYLGDQLRHPDIGAYVYELLDKLTPIGQGNLVDVARALYVHPRGLQRELAAAGTTFEGLLDGWRQNVAAKLLAAPQIPLAEVARQLGYSEQSTLARSCRRWFGETPLRTRRRLREAT